MVIAAAPFFARLVEILLREVDRGVIEACRALGATTRQTVFWALLPETLTGYANLVAARPANVSSPAIQKLVAALTSPAAKKFVQDTYHGAVLTLF